MEGNVARPRETGYPAVGTGYPVIPKTRSLGGTIGHHRLQAHLETSMAEVNQIQEEILKRSR